MGWCGVGQGRQAVKMSGGREPRDRMNHDEHKEKLFLKGMCGPGGTSGLVGYG